MWQMTAVSLLTVFSVYLCISKIKMDLTSGNLFKDERQIRHFGFTSKEFISEFRDCVRTEVEEVLQVLQNPATDETSTQDVAELRQLLLNPCEKALKQLETMADQLFAIPENVVLAGEIGPDNRITDEDVEKLRQEVEELENQFCEETYYLGLLKNSRQRFDAIKPLYEATERNLKWLDAEHVQEKCLIGQEIDAKHANAMEQTDVYDRRLFDAANNVF